MTTVPGVMDAFNEIYAFGRRCNSSYQETHRASGEHHFHGNGDDFYESCQIADFFKDCTLPAETMLRIVAADDGSLYLHQRLTWQTSFGYRHESHATYLITPAAAEHLAATDVESLEFNPPSIFDSQGNVDTRDAMRAMHVHFARVAKEAAVYHAVWEQVLPPKPQLYKVFENDPDLESEASSETIGEVYHSAALEAVVARASATTCMLAPTTGIVHPQQLVTIAEWVRAQPQPPLAG